MKATRRAAEGLRAGLQRPGVAGADAEKLQAGEPGTREGLHREVLSLGVVDEPHDRCAGELIEPDLAEVQRAARDARGIDPVGDDADDARVDHAADRHALGLAGGDRHHAVSGAREAPLDRSEQGALRSREERVEEEGEGVRRAHTGADSRGQGSAAAEDTRLRAVGVDDVRLLLPRASPWMRRRWTRSPAGRIARTIGTWITSTPRSPRAPRGRRRSRVPGADTARDTDSQPALTAGDVDEVTARTADRRLHDVQDVHPGLRRGQKAPVPLATAKPVRATITRSSRNDWFSM